jgi:hypothetical protein
MPFWIKVAFWIVEAIGLWRLYREITRVRASTVRSGKPVAHHMRWTDRHISISLVRTPQR